MAEVATAPSSHAHTSESGVEIPAAPSAWRRLGLGFWLSTAWLAVVVAFALLAPVFNDDPTATRLAGPFEGPSSELWFGADATGRDVFALTIWGARTSLLVGFIEIFVGFFFGGALGIAAGYFRGLFDKIVSFVFSVLLSFPALLLAIFVTDLLGRTLFWVSISLGVLAIAPVGRLARAQTMVFAEKEFVTAARILGAGDARILWREIIPNVVIPMSALALLGMGIAIVAEGTLAFLGVSVDGGLSWGRQIFASGSTREFLQSGPHAALFPIAAVTLTVLALNYAGDRLREIFDAKELSL